MINRLFSPMSGISIVYSEYCLKEGEERLFPVSRHRSKRIHKKLIKRFGGEFRKVPAIFKTPQGIIMHPNFRAEFERNLEESSNV